MNKIHSEDKKVLLKVSPLIDFRKRSVSEPLHTLAQNPPTSHTQVELSPIHNFMDKLLQPSVIEKLHEYVLWQSQWRREYHNGKSLEEMLESAPASAPVSINLDLTTACNYRCGHCVDMDILNTGIRFDHKKLVDGLNQLIDKGLKSVIIIGGGEPTAYPEFEEIVRHLKHRGIKIGVVTNGSFMNKILAVSDVLTKGDWVRLSLDSASNDTFTAMHKPVSKKCTLDWICEHIPPIKKANPHFDIGFSFIIVWKDCHDNPENINEIYDAAKRAHKYEFDYISYKPFLTRAEENNAEIVDLVKSNESDIDMIISTIRKEIDRTKTLATDKFKIIESTNLRVLENKSYKEYLHQPHTCHMQFFRQVLSPLGVFNCPVYRHVPQALIGGKHLYSDDFSEAHKNTLRLIESFDATTECNAVTCLYNHANWFIEDLIENPQKLADLTPSDERNDYFL